MNRRFKRDKDTPFTLAASAVFLAIMVGALWYAITQGDTTAIFFTLVLVFWLPALSVVGWAAQTEREMTDGVEVHPATEGARSLARQEGLSTRTRYNGDSVVLRRTKATRRDRRLQPDTLDGKGKVVKKGRSAD